MKVLPFLLALALVNAHPHNTNDALKDKLLYYSKYPAYIEKHNATDLLREKFPSKIKEKLVVEPITEPVQVIEQTYPQLSLIEPCGYTAEQLEQRINGNLKDCAKYFIEAEQKFGVNAVFLVAIAAIESGWGTSNLAYNNNNLYGWKGSNGYSVFEDYRDCILHVAEALKNNYLSPDGKYFNGYTVEGVNKVYCGSPHWETLVKDVMQQIIGR